MASTQAPDSADAIVRDPARGDWGDVACLERSVERLAAEVDELHRITTVRNVIATGALAVLFATIAACTLTCPSLAGALVLALYIGNSLILVRACLLDLLDQERARQADVTERWTRDVQDHLDRTDRLLSP